MTLNLDIQVPRYISMHTDYLKLKDFAMVGEKSKMCISEMPKKALKSSIFTPIIVCF